MALISDHRAGKATRQARAAIRAPRPLGGALRDVHAQNGQLIDIVNPQAAATAAWAGARSQPPTVERAEEAPRSLVSCACLVGVG